MNEPITAPNSTSRSHEAQPPRPGAESGKPLMESAPGPVTVIDGRDYLYFAGTGYLGLQGHRDLCRAACAAVEQYGLASATSRARLGNNPPTLDVERAAAEFFGTADAFYFVSGYVANMIFLQACGEVFDVVFADELSHFSLWDAVALSGRPVQRFAHRDTESLASALAARLRPGERPLVISDGVFAVSGRIAPVADYLAVLQIYDGAAVYLDDAHALGVLGELGRGTWEHAGCAPSQVNVWQTSGSWPDGVRRFFGGTLSKALGGFGGILPGTDEFVARLKSRSHFYDGASQPPVPAAAATACALRIVRDQPALRDSLRANARRLRAGLRGLGLDVEDTPVPVVGLTIGSAANMQRIEQELRTRGIIVPYFASYSGVAPQGVLRVAVFASHTPAMLDRLLGELGRLL